MMLICFPNNVFLESSISTYFVPENRKISSASGIPSCEHEIYFVIYFFLSCNSVLWKT